MLYSLSSPFDFAITFVRLWCAVLSLFRVSCFDIGLWLLEKLGPSSLSYCHVSPPCGIALTLHTFFFFKYSCFVPCLLYFLTSLSSSDLVFLLRVFVARLKLSIVYRHLDFGATKYLSSNSGCSWNTPPNDYARSDTNSVPVCTTLACHVLNMSNLLQYEYTLQIMCRTDLLRQSHISVQDNRINFCFGVF